MIVSIIVAVAENNVIGKDNKLIWHLPADLKFFKSLTMGHHMIMGRKTFESIGKALPGRTSIVVTHQPSYHAEGCIVVNSIKEAFAKISNDSEVFIIGGDAIFKQSLAFTSKIYFTRIHHSFEGDTFFPELNENEWELKERTDFAPDEKNEYPYSFCTYVRKSA